MVKDKEDLEARIQGDMQREIILAQADNQSRPYSLVFFDIDHFKAFNDLYSYPQGDEVLNGIQFLLKQMREEGHFVGIYGNYGGDEFLVALPATSIDDATKVAERLQQTAKIHQFENIETHAQFEEIVSLSLGISFVDLKEYLQSPADENARKAFKKLLQQSNIALDYGKALGGGMVQKFHEFLDSEWQRIKSFRQFYFKAPFMQTLQLDHLNMPSGLLEHIQEDFSYLAKRLKSYDTRILASFADKAYSDYILTFAGEKDTLISGLQKAVNQ